MTLRNILSVIIALGVAWVPAAGLAQGAVDLTVQAAVDCDLATFTAAATGGALPFALAWEFGDGDSLNQTDVQAFPLEVIHLYPAPGDYGWSVTATDADGLTGDASGTLTIDGPTVALSSDPFPPLLYLQDGQASADFTAEVTGGTAPYEFEWDLDGDGASDPGGDPGQASFSYSAAGGYLASVTVSDACGMTSTDTLRVVVIDLDAEACHPMAQRIADAVNTLFPSQADQLYTCADIYEYFTGGLIGSQLGFGRMWHAYQLTQTIPDLTWEEILDWHLAGNGWGGLVQLYRFAARTGAELDQIASAREAGFSWGQIRQAMRLAEDGDWMSVLETGIAETRQQLREQARDERDAAREAARGERDAGRDERTAAQLAAQYGVSEAQVWNLFDGSCSGDWKCVRAALREASGRGGGRKP